MNRMRRQPRSLRTVLVMGAGAVSVVAIALTVGTLWLFASLRRDFERELQASFDEQHSADEIVSAVYGQIVASYRQLQAPSDANLARFDSLGETAYARVSLYLVQSMSLESRLQVEAVKEMHQTLEVQARSAFELHRRGELDASHARVAELEGRATQLQREMESFVSLRDHERHEVREQQVLRAQRLLVAMAVLVVLLAASIVILVRTVRRRVVVPLRQFSNAAARLGAGDFTARIPDQRTAELQTVARRFNEMAQRIRDSRTLEDQLRQAQKMEAVGQLASGVAHDFNNLLTVIGAHAEFLKQHPMIPAGEALDDIEQILKSSERAGRLTSQLLAFSRKQVLKVVPLDLNVLIRDTEPMLRRLIGDHVAICMLDSSAPSVAVADTGQMEQVLVNLVVNARDAMPSGGVVTIETANVRLKGAAPRRGEGIMPSGEYVRLSVTDTGTGIHPDVVPRVFEPFFTTKETGKGTGLGLATTYGIVKQCGGYIWIDSTLGVGTTFRVYLPRAVDATLATPRTASAPVEVGGTETILVAEDEDAIRTLILRILERSGYTVLTSRHGRDALQVASDYFGTIDLVLTDLMMPELGGLELVQQLRRARPEIAVLYMSGYTDLEIHRHGELQADVGLMHKPFTQDGLLHHVREALNTHEPACVG